MLNVKDLEAQEHKQETFESWQARDFILDEIGRDTAEEEKLVKLYEYLTLLKEYDDELGLK